MQSLELLLDLIAIVFVLYATYEQKGNENLALAGDINSLELTKPVFWGFSLVNPQEETTDDDNIPPWDVDEVVEIPTLEVPKAGMNQVDGLSENGKTPKLKVPEEGLIPFDVDEPYIPSRNEVFDDQETTKELSIDVNQITAKNAWKAAKALGLSYKNPDRSRIKVTILRQNIEAALVKDPSKIQDVLPFVG